MTPEAQNIALAEACGWTSLAELSDQGMSYWAGLEPHLRRTQRVSIPNFVADLNAQFEAWQKLTVEQKFAFRNWVRRIAMRENIWAEEAQATFGSECLLRALGKWIE